jgi:hypothetical protein
VRTSSGPFFGEPLLIDQNQFWTYFWRTMVNRSEPVVDPFLRTMVMNPDLTKLVARRSQSSAGSGRI